MYAGTRDLVVTQVLARRVAGNGAVRRSRDLLLRMPAFTVGELDGGSKMSNGMPFNLLCVLVVAIAQQRQARLSSPLPAVTPRAWSSHALGHPNANRCGLSCDR